MADPIEGCDQYNNPNEIRGQIALVKRGKYTFAERGFFANNSRAIGLVIIGS